MYYELAVRMTGSNVGVARSFEEVMVTMDCWVGLRLFPA